jgi:methionyl aminopeptidase
MIIIKTPTEVQAIHEAGKVVHACLEAMKAAIIPGESTTYDLEQAAIKVITKSGGSSAFLGYAPHGCPPYPAWTCISVNEEVVHGIPGRRVLHEGDVVGCDVGVKLNGYYADAAWTFPVGKVSEETERLLRCGQECLAKAIEHALYGKRLGDVCNTIQKNAHRYGYSVVRDLVGHGVGKELHEEPPIPNYGKPGVGVLLKEGMTLAFEPMINTGRSDVEALEDGWTIVTRDRSISVHFEHTIAITRQGPVILTQRD